MFGEKYDYSCRLNSQIQSICKFTAVKWQREIKAELMIRLMNKTEHSIRKSRNL